jgi:hypothetical protein
MCGYEMLSMVRKLWWIEVHWTAMESVSTRRFVLPEGRNQLQLLVTDMRALHTQFQDTVASSF